MKHPSISSSITVVYLPSLGEVTGVRQNGRLKHEQLTKVYNYNNYTIPTVYCMLYSLHLYSTCVYSGKFYPKNFTLATIHRDDCVMHACRDLTAVWKDA